MEEKKEQQEEEKKLSPLEETKEALLQITKEKEEIQKIKEDISTLRSDQLLSGVAGGRVAEQEVSVEESKKKEALDFWKGTAIADAIDKHYG